MKILFGILLVNLFTSSKNAGENLLKRIHTTVHEPASNRKRFEASHRPIVSVLERTRSRQQQLLEVRSQLLGARSQNQPSKLEPKENLLFSSRNQLLGGECQAFKTENRILKQQLLAVQKQLQQLEKRMGMQFDEPVRALQLLDKIQEKSKQAAVPLDTLLQTDVEAPLELTSSLITRSPTISTILETTSFITTLTETMTRELLVNFHGKKLPTQVLDTEVHVETVTSVLTSTIEITPTPTYKTLTITPTVTRLSHVPVTPQLNDLFAKMRQNQERNDLINKIKSLNSFKPEEPRSVDRTIVNTQTIGTFESFQEYLQNILQPKAEETKSFPPKTYKTVPTVSSSTIYISGSVPGQFSTSVITVNPYEEVQNLTRKKRYISPSPTVPIAATQFWEINDDNTEIARDMGIVRPSVMHLGTDDNDRKEFEYNTVTVKITMSAACLP